MLKPGIYIHLFHGRENPEEEMEDWGDDGPVLGPFDWLHVTYLCTFALGCVKDVVWDLETAAHCEGLVYYDGVYYGDFDIVSQADERNVKHAEPFDVAKAVVTTKS